MEADDDYVDELLGTTLAAKYEIVDLLGAGGFGAVYRAIQHPVGREVAVKVIRPEHARSDELRQRFFREARVVAGLSHRSTVTLFDYGETDDGMLYMVLEFVDGQCLSDVLVEQGRMPPAHAVGLVVQILGALAEGHQRGVVHRDLKPANLMLVTDSFGAQQVKVLDFGIAKVLADQVQDSIATRTGMVLGTPAYMSPEQAVGRGIGPGSDLYSLGIILYEMLAGVLPFQADSAFEMLTKHTNEPPPQLPQDLEVTEELREALDRTLEKKAEDRFPNAREMARTLHMAIGSRDSLTDFDRLTIRPGASLESPVTSGSGGKRGPSTEKRGEAVSVEAPRAGVSLLVVGLVLLAALGLATVVALGDRNPSSTNSSAAARPAARAKPAAPPPEVRKPAPVAEPEVEKAAAKPAADEAEVVPYDPLAQAIEAAKAGSPEVSALLKKALEGEGGEALRERALGAAPIRELAERDAEVREALGLPALTKPEAKPKRRVRPRRPKPKPAKDDKSRMKRL